MSETDNQKVYEIIKDSYGKTNNQENKAEDDNIAGSGFAIDERICSTPNSNNIHSKPKEVQENEPFEAWVTLVAVTMCNVIVGFHKLAFGMYYVSFTDVFDTTKALSGTIGACFTFFSNFSGIFASVVLKRYGCKVCAITGCLIVSTGIFLSSWANDIYQLIITYGMVAGIGTGFVALSSSTVIQLRFNKHRALATSITLCGMPLGNLIAPITIALFIRTFGWRGSLLLHSAIFLNTLVFISLWRCPSLENKPNITNMTFVCFIKNICDFSPLRNVYFCVFILASCCYMFNVIVFFDQLASRAVFYGLNFELASMLLTYLFICSLVSRISISVYLRFFKVNPLFLGTVIGFIQGSVAICIGLSSNYAWMITCIVIYGLAQGGLVIQALLCTVKITGVENFARSRAVHDLLFAFSSLIPTPLTGWVFDITQNYNYPFFIAGGVGLIGAMLMFTLSCIILVKDKKEKKTTNQSVAKTIEISVINFVKDKGEETATNKA